VIGTNQNADKTEYKGSLYLSLDGNNRIIAKWIISNTQEQTGIGFFKSNILVINFDYLGYENKIFKGTVVYKCLNKNILEGFWFEDKGDPKFIGTENCFRVQENLVN
jgi:hypothetical protein